MRLGLLLVIAACASSPSSSPRPGPHYPLHPGMRSASGGPIELVGEVAQPGVIPYTPGITFTCALRLAGGPTAMADRALLHRGTRTFVLPLRRIVDHVFPDLELAPGDIVTIQSFAE